MKQAQMNAERLEEELRNQIHKAQDVFEIEILDEPMMSHHGQKSKKRNSISQASSNSQEGDQDMTVEDYDMIEPPRKDQSKVKKSKKPKHQRQKSRDKKDGRNYMEFKDFHDSKDSKDMQRESTKTKKKVRKSKSPKANSGVYGGTKKDMGSRNQKPFSPEKLKLENQYDNIEKINEQLRMIELQKQKEEAMAYMNQKERHKPSPDFVMIKDQNHDDKYFSHRHRSSNEE